ncbi:MAG: Txe/YoeB family addiction module toxin [Magnetococcales bacterium]|nr:Txe/YoeB family addiction module toxin [Magnetococcales bacterium]
MNITFERGAFDDFTAWAGRDRQVYRRIISLIVDITRNPLGGGIGKPEPLRHELQGYWSRRITEEHRLVYKIEGDSVVIVSCKYHYL